MSDEYTIRKEEQRRRTRKQNNIKAENEQDGRIKTKVEELERGGEEIGGMFGKERQEKQCTKNRMYTLDAVKDQY